MFPLISQYESEIKNVLVMEKQYLWRLACSVQLFQDVTTSSHLEQCLLTCLQLWSAYCIASYNAGLLLEREVSPLSVAHTHTYLFMSHCGWMAITIKVVTSPSVVGKTLSFYHTAPIS